MAESDVYLRVCWARSERYTRPHVVIAMSSSLWEAFPEAWQDKRDEAMLYFTDFGDDEGPWTFWETTAVVQRTELPTPEMVIAPAVAAGREQRL